jgi:hypothetical protein
MYILYLLGILGGKGMMLLKISQSRFMKHRIFFNHVLLSTAIGWRSFSLFCAISCQLICNTFSFKISNITHPFSFFPHSLLLSLHGTFCYLLKILLLYFNLFFSLKKKVLFSLVCQEFFLLKTLQSFGTLLLVIGCVFISMDTPVEFCLSKS